MSTPLAGWYADPWQAGRLRYWDGLQWTAATQPVPRPTTAARLRVPARVLGPGAVVAFAVSGTLAMLIVLLEVGLVAFALAAAAAVLLLPVYALAALSLDRFHPEPKAALAWTFAAGATTVVLCALVINSVLSVLVDVAADSGTTEVVSAAFIAPVVEEGAKAAVLLLLYRRFRHQISGPLDGIVYAAMVGLGFATVENVLYYGRAIADGSLPGVFLVRGVFSPFAHPVFTACTGIGLGLLAAGRTRLGFGAPLLGLVLAMVLHGLWNGTGFLSGWAFLLTFVGVMVPVFVLLIVLARREARRERRTLPQYLQPEVERGLLTPLDVQALSDVGKRKQLLRTARALHPAAGAAARALPAEALELAATRERIANGAFSPRYGAPEQAVAELVDRVAQARWALPPAPPQVPHGGIAAGLGIPVAAAWPASRPA